MITGEVVSLMKVLAAYDGRNVGEADLMVWGRQMAEVELGDAIEAVHQHYGETRDWAMPSDVRRLARRLYNRRNRRPEVVAPGCVEPDPDERRRLTVSADGQLALPARGSDPLTDRSEEIRGFVRQVRGALPEGDPDSLRHGTKYWREEQTQWQRQRSAEPNPSYDPLMSRPVEWQRLDGEPKGAWWENEAKREAHAKAELDKVGRLYPSDAS